MVEISTSILSIKKEDIIKKIYELEIAHTDFFHIDVMDGKFVENDTSAIMLEYSEYIKQITNIPLDVHLMVKDVYSYVNSYLSLNPNIITFHIEAVESAHQVLELINYIKENGVKVGIALNPETEIEKIIPFLPYIHQVLIMSVKPGKGGQTFIESTFNKVQVMQEAIKKNKLEIDISVDGGINLDNIEKLKNLKINIAVAGTSIINSKDYKETIKKLKKENVL